MPRARTPESEPPTKQVREIADKLVQTPALLALRSKRLVIDTMIAKGVRMDTAQKAVALARRVAHERGIPVW